MESGVKAAILIPSINPPHQIEASGFELADEAAHMIAWLGRGSAFRQFVANDIESELYRQTPGAQLLSIRCNAKPDFRTTAIQDGSGQNVVATDVSVTFPVTVRVKAADGAIWKLDIQHNYDATSIHLHDGRRQLRLNFAITAHVQES